MRLSNSERREGSDAKLPLVDELFDEVLEATVSYDKAQICSNGHIITADVGRLKGSGMEKFCSRCGAETLLACECGQAIRGRYWVTGQELPYTRPSFCPACGRAYPWTQDAMDAAREYASELRLEVEQKEFADLIENLVRDTARSSISASRMKSLLEKAGPFAVEGFKKILFDVVTDGAKRMIWS